MKCDKRDNWITAPSSLIFVFSLLPCVICAVLGAESKYPPGTELYSVHFLSKDELESSFFQKCCGITQMLTEDGKCEPLDFQLPTEFHLERRVREAVESPPETEQLHFRTLPRRPSCDNGERVITTHDSHSNNLKLTPALQYITNIEVEEEDDKNTTLIVDPRDYCIDWSSPDSVVVEYCRQQSCLSAFHSSSNLKASRKHSKSHDQPSQPSCLLKCCPPSEVIDFDSFTCVKHDIPWRLFQSRPVYANTSNEQRTSHSDNSTSLQNMKGGRREINRIPLRPTWLTALPNCNATYEVYIENYDRYYVNSMGVLITEKSGTIAKTPPGEYCLDAVLPSSMPMQYRYDPGSSEEGDKVNASLLHGVYSETVLLSRQIALVCFEETRNDKNSNWVYAILTGTSCVFLLATCVILGILKKDLNLPGWLQFSYAVSLLLTFTLLTVAQLWTQWIHDVSKTLCSVLGYGLHFCFLSCFSWLTSMNVDLWLSFRSSAIVRGFGKSRGKRRFLEFAAFSIGFPAAVTLLVLAVDNTTPNDPNFRGFLWTLPTSGIGEDACVISVGRKAAQLHYFYGFVGVLLLINLVIFICTLISLRDRERETRMAKRQSTSNADYDRNTWLNLNRLQLFTRLFLIMGILWIFEFVSWLFQYFETDEKFALFFYVTDCLNALQGLAVFAMFVWKRQTLKQLKKKFKTCGLRRTGHPLSRPSFNNCTASCSHTGTVKSSSMKSSHLSSTKSTDSSRLPSTSVTTVDNEVYSRK